MFVEVSRGLGLEPEDVLLPLLEVGFGGEGERKVDAAVDELERVGVEGLETGFHGWDLGDGAGGNKAKTPKKNSGHLP